MLITYLDPWEQRNQAGQKGLARIPRRHNLTERLVYPKRVAAEIAIAISVARGDGFDHSHHSRAPHIIKRGEYRAVFCAAREGPFFVHPKCGALPSA